MNTSCCIAWPPLSHRFNVHVLLCPTTTLRRYRWRWQSYLSGHLRCLGIILRLSTWSAFFDSSNIPSGAENQGRNKCGGLLCALRIRWANKKCSAKPTKKGLCACLAFQVVGLQALKGCKQVTCIASVLCVDLHLCAQQSNSPQLSLSCQLN